MINFCKCLLRPMGLTDLPQVLLWRNSEKVRVASLNSDVISSENHYAWFEKQEQDPTVKLFVFEYGMVPIGVVNFSKIDFDCKTASWGFYRGTTMMAVHGLGLAMGWMGLSYIFDECGMERVFAESLRANQISLRFHSKFGFVEDCQNGFQIVSNGQSEDVARLSLSAEKWSQVQLVLKEYIFA